MNKSKQTATRLAEDGAHYRVVLKDLTGGHPKVTSAVLATLDGFEVASAHHESRARAEHLAAMASSLLAVARAASREVQHASCERLLIESTTGKLLIRPLSGSSSLLLCLVLAPDAVLGAALWLAEEIAKAIELATPTIPVPPVTLPLT